MEVFEFNIHLLVLVNEKCGNYRNIHPNIQCEYNDRKREL